MINVAIMFIHFFPFPFVMPYYVIMVKAADTSQVACCSGRTLAATQLNVVRMRLREERAKGEKKKNEK